MNGNLVACVCNEDFDHPIWMLAARRELNRSNGIVALDFYVDARSSPQASMEASQVASVWNATKLTLIASPTYFRSFEPILRRLQATEEVGLPFQEELVHCKTAEKRPLSLCAADAVDRSLVFSGPGLHSDVSYQLVGTTAPTEMRAWALSKQTTICCPSGRSLFDIGWNDLFKKFRIRNSAGHQILIVSGEQTGPGKAASSDLATGSGGLARKNRQSQSPLSLGALPGDEAGDEASAVANVIQSGAEAHVPVCCDVVCGLRGGSQSASCYPVAWILPVRFVWFELNLIEALLPGPLLLILKPERLAESCSTGSFCVELLLADPIKEMPTASGTMAGRALWK